MQACLGHAAHRHVELGSIGMAAWGQGTPVVGGSVQGGFKNRMGTLFPVEFSHTP
jgi:hypothetical protein